MIPTAKAAVSAWGLFGGTPTFSEPLHVGRPNVLQVDRFLARLREALDRRWLTNDGPLVRELESRLRSLTGARHCLAVCNGTAGLELVARALDLTGEVIVPAFTFVATVHALQWLGLAPVFCDVDPRTHALDPARVERHITPRTSAILAVHMWGHPCDVESLSRIAARRGLALFFDAAHALGASWKGRRVGTFGQAEVFSFHATKFVHSFEGGAIATNDDRLAERIRLLRNFGFSGAFDQVDALGINAKMSEVHAAMGLTSLDSFEEIVAVNRRNVRLYGEVLRDVPGLTLLPHDRCETCNFQYVVAEVDETRFGLSRDVLVRLLHAENVLARRYFYPGCHRMAPYRDLYPEASQHLPVTEQLCQRVLVLPNGTSIGELEIQKIGEMIRMAALQSTEIRARLK